MNKNISFKLLAANKAKDNSLEWIEKDKGEKWELEVEACNYEGREVKKIFIVLKSEFLLVNGKNKSFLIRSASKVRINNLLDNQIALEILGGKVDYRDIIENEFRFRAKSISEAENHWKIVLSHSVFWNEKDKIEEIQLQGSLRNQGEEFLHPNKDLIIKGVKDFELSSNEKELIIKVIDLEKIEKTEDLFGSLNLEILVTSWKDEGNNSYLLICQEIKSKKYKALGNYKKIRITLEQEAQQNLLETNKKISLKVKDLFAIVQRITSDILQINEEFSEFQPFSAPEKNKENKENKEKVTKIIKEFEDEYKAKYAEEKINNWLKRLKIGHQLFKQVFAKLNDSQGKELATNFSQLSKKIEKIKNGKEFHQEITRLENLIFTSQSDYQKPEKLKNFSAQLKQLEKEFEKLEEDLINYEELRYDYLQTNWKSIYRNDQQLNNFLVQNWINQEGFITCLDWNKSYPWLEENGTINYPALKAWFDEEKQKNALPNNLGYLPAEIKKGGEYEEWNKANINKEEASQAQMLDYSISQWKDNNYNEYKKRKQSRIVADAITDYLEKKWKPALTESEKTKIQTSSNSLKLVKNINEIQEQKTFNHAKNHAKKLVEQELKKNPLVEIKELEIYQTYQKGFEKIDELAGIETYRDQIMEKISKARIKKISSLEKAQTEAKKNIAASLKEFRLNSNKLDSHYHNYQKKIKAMKNIPAVCDFEQEMTTLIADLDDVTKQTWFFPLAKKEIRQAKNIKYLRNEIKTRQKEQLIELIISQTNQYLQSYNQLLKKERQNYNLQRQKLAIAQELMEEIKELRSLNQEEEKIYEAAKNTNEHLEKLTKIHNLAERFNNLADQEEKRAILIIIQNQFKKMTNLTHLEEISRQEVAKNLTLLQKNEDAEALVEIINEKQSAISLLTSVINKDLEEEKEETVVTEDKKDWESWQKNLLAGFIIFFLLWFIYRWWKKRHEDPFI